MRRVQFVNTQVSRVECEGYSNVKWSIHPLLALIAGATESELAKRPSITDSDRDRLELLIHMQERAIIPNRLEFNPGNKNGQQRVLRRAIRRALLNAGLLTTTKRADGHVPRGRGELSNH